MKKIKWIMFQMVVAFALTGILSCSGDDDVSGGSDSKVPSYVEAVDLGLSVKWSNVNIGAKTPYDYGDYYAWGETETKFDYSWSTYFDTTDGGSTFTKYNTNGGKTVLDPEDDVAHVKLGGTWRMPTDAELTELREKCTWVWTTENGVNGYKVTGTNGNFIFLPAAGYYRDTALNNDGSWGYCWSSSLNAVHSSHVWRVYFKSGHIYRDYCYRSYGQAVRPVCQ